MVQVNKNWKNIYYGLQNKIGNHDLTYWLKVFLSFNPDKTFFVTKYGYYAVLRVFLFLL